MTLEECFIAAGSKFPFKAKKSDWTKDWICVFLAKGYGPEEWRFYSKHIALKFKSPTEYRIFSENQKDWDLQ